MIKNNSLFFRSVLTSFALGIAIATFGIYGAIVSTSPATSNEPYRSEYHFSPPSNWLGFPNGPVYLNGQYQLYCQTDPAQKTENFGSWGHATSPEFSIELLLV